MPFVPVPNTVLAELRMSLDGQRVENTLYFRRGFTPTVAEITALGNALITWWGAFVADYTNAAVTLEEVFLTDLTTAIASAVSVPATSGIIGTIGGDFIPANASLAVSFRTANRGRSFRGRNYIVGLSEDSVTGNTVDPDVVTLIELAYNQLLSSLPGTSGWTWSVVSRFSGIGLGGVPIPRTTGLATTITSVNVVDPIVDSQRRRLPGRGQ